MAFLFPAGRTRRLVLVIIGLVLLLLVLRTPAPELQDNIGKYRPAFKRPTFKYPGASKPEPAPAQEQEPHLPVSTEPPRARVSKELQDILEWDPPVDIEDHYPPYGDYGHRDYDPNRWETFDQRTEFYLNGGIKRLPSRNPAPKTYLPYPSYNSNSWLQKWRGHYVYCEGPRGVPFNKSYDDLVLAYQGIPDGFPYPDVGSFDAIGVDANVCFDRYSRLGPYGLRPGHGESDAPKDRHNPDFLNVKWGSLQYECLDRNKARYQSAKPPTLRTGISRPDSAQQALDSASDPLTKKDNEEKLSKRQRSAAYKPRTAVLIRTWDNYEYQANDHHNIRSIVQELSLLSGGEYQVFLLVHVKDKTIPIWDDPRAYDTVLEQTVPPEFRDMAILWNEQIFHDWYPNVGEEEVYWQQFMPLQWFSKTHPEYEYVWNWEMDARYIGSHYHFLDKVADFAKRQPRKFLWERNARFYFPLAHGNWDSFVNQTNSIIASSPWVNAVWGPKPWSEDQMPIGPLPPVQHDYEDNFSWGTQDEADFITLLPIFDPTDTFWAYRDKLFNYPTSTFSTEEHPYPHVPRRTYINTLVRLSKTLLHAMHTENSKGLGMAPEMWPSSIALQHGLKAVYAPHPIWMSHKWDPKYLEWVFNADGWGAGSGPGNIDQGRGLAYNETAETLGKHQLGSGPNNEGASGRWSIERDSVYNPDREHNFGGFSWYFWSDFPRIIYSRWLGWKAGFTIMTPDGLRNTDALGMAGGKKWEEDLGRLCLPGMLLHPVKDVKPPEASRSVIPATPQNQLSQGNDRPDDPEAPAHGQPQVGEQQQIPQDSQQ